MSKLMPDCYLWEAQPEAEVERLAGLLAAHLRTAGIPKQERTAENCRVLVRAIIEKQKGTCYLAGGDDRYCWNHPKNKILQYLKLEWGHKIPKSQGGSTGESNLILLCARCNNHLQTSRTLKQLLPELEHKVSVLKRMEIE